MIMRIDKTKAIKNAELATAREEGMNQGVEQGIEQGMAIGENKKALEIAANLLKIGTTLEQISEVTGLSIEQIIELQEEQD